MGDAEQTSCFAARAPVLLDASTASPHAQQPAYPLQNMWSTRGESEVLGEAQQHAGGDIVLERLQGQQVHLLQEAPVWNQNIDFDSYTYKNQNIDAYKNQKIGVHHDSLGEVAGGRGGTGGAGSHTGVGVEVDVITFAGPRGGGKYFTKTQVLLLQQQLQQAVPRRSVLRFLLRSGCLTFIPKVLNAIATTFLPELAGAGRMGDMECEGLLSAGCGID